MQELGESASAGGWSARRLPDRGPRRARTLACARFGIAFRPLPADRSSVPLL